jgi:hypothetical protein
MKTPTHTDLVLRSSLALALALAIWSPVQSQSAEPAEGKMMMNNEMMERCQDIKEQKQKMMAEMKAQDAELTALVAKMNRASKDQKLDLLADIVSHLVEQQAVMNVQKAKLEAEMMKHMMQHLQMGKESVSQCPMLKGMEEKAGEAPKEKK